MATTASTAVTAAMGRHLASWMGNLSHTSASKWAGGLSRKEGGAKIKAASGLVWGLLAVSLSAAPPTVRSRPRRDSRQATQPGEKGAVEERLQRLWVTLGSADPEEAGGYNY